MDTKRSVGLVEPRRRRWALEAKRRIVEETLAPGASVAVIARRHAVNANQLFGWRRLHRLGQLGSKLPALAPVRIEAPVEKPAGAASVAPASAALLEIEFADGARLRVHGRVPGATLAACVRAMRSR